jgi:purine-binding chemotaxis protein CheW
MTGIFTKTIQEEKETQHGKFLTFELSKEVYGIEICFVTEIVGVQKFSSLPGSPAFIKGIINLRGKIIPVVDMRLRFKKEPVEYTNQTCTVVIDIQNLTVGLIVDRVREVIVIPDDCIAPLPSTGIGYRNRFIKGIGKTGDAVQLLLDCEQLFKNEEVEIISQMKE